MAVVDMKDDNIDKIIEQYYFGQDLAPQKKDQILNITSGRTTSGRKWRIGLSTQTAAAILIAGVSIWLGSLYVDYHQQRSILFAAAQEVALNHRKNLAAEFTLPFPLKDGLADANSLNKKNLRHLANQMKRLDFPITPLTRVKALEGHRIQGSRYCSIQGNLAIQLRLELSSVDKETDRLTAFVARPAATLKEFVDFSTRLNAIAVQ